VSGALGSKGLTLERMSPHGGQRREGGRSNSFHQISTGSGVVPAGSSERRGKEVSAELLVRSSADEASLGSVLQMAEFMADDKGEFVIRTHELQECRSNDDLIRLAGECSGRTVRDDVHGRAAQGRIGDGESRDNTLNSMIGDQWAWPRIRRRRQLRVRRRESTGARQPRWCPNVYSLANVFDLQRYPSD
jgi:hypothetical protein